LGSGGLGGRRYQIAAVILTYAAVSMAAIPVSISQMREARKARATAGQSASTDGESTETPQSPKEKMSAGQAFAYLALLGLASPFLDLQSPVGGLIGLVILYVGLQIAWKMMAGRPVPEITGPY
jgi:hypothetical protein